MQVVAKKSINEMNMNLGLSVLERQNPRVLSCDIGNNPHLDPELCGSFHPILSSAGISFGFNFGPTSQYLKMSENLRKYSDIFDLVSLDNDVQVQTGTTKLRLVLQLSNIDLHMKGLDADEAVPQRESRSGFLLNLQDRNLFPDLHLESIFIETQVIHNIKVTPTIQESNLVDNEPLARKVTGGCLFAEETKHFSAFNNFLVHTDSVRNKTTLSKKELDIMSKYSTNGCYFECMFQHAVKQCNCRPWIYPSYNEQGYGNIAKCHTSYVIYS